jgi:predicted nucleotidyltransferase
MAEPRDLTSILGVLLEEGVDFVLVGALAAVAQGASVTTHDVDIVHARTPENLERLMAALARMSARYRGRAAGESLPPDRAALATTGRSLLMTDMGPLDCLGAIESGLEWNRLLPLSVEVDFEGHRLRMLGLETLVALKRGSKEPKDRLVLPVLEETLRRTRAAAP